MGGEPVTWVALIFLSGVILGTIGWTYWFWKIVVSRDDFKDLEKRVRDIEK